jgi:uncharacterized coiled-coil protein SlyX
MSPPTTISMEERKDPPERFLAFSELQSAKEAELRIANANITELKETVIEHEKLLELHMMQQKVLKEEFRKLEGSKYRAENLKTDELKEALVAFLSDRNHRSNTLDKIVVLLQLNLEEKRKIEENFGLIRLPTAPILSSRGSGVRADASPNSPARVAAASSSSSNLWGMFH